jgi:acetylornithine deacetylase/succinyl-diaminopimelate desuccinylase-like protein
MIRSVKLAARLALGVGIFGLAMASPAGALKQGAAPVSQADRQLARDILEELIGYRTAKGRGQVPAMAEALAKRFRAAGFREEDIQLLPLEVEGEKTVGLIVRYAGTSKGEKPIALLGHMDVVDALAENWATDPYKPIEKDGYIYGRGAVDNKAQVSLISATFIRLKRAGFVPNRDLVIAFSGDEETGMRTTRLLTQHPFVKGAEFALNGDAGSGSVSKDGSAYDFNIQSAEKTTATFSVAASNRGGHSSAPRPDNAIFELADALKRIQAHRFPVEFNEISKVMVKDLAAENKGELGAALTKLMENPNDAAAIQVAAKYPEHSNLLWTTCVPTMLRAGNAPNALPQNAVATVNCRIFPGTPVAAVQAKLQQVVANDKIKISLDAEAVESPVSPVREDLFASLRRAVHANYPGAPVKPSMSAGGTDGREFRRAGIPTYGAGSLLLVRPDDSRAHGTDERVPLKSFYKELTFWDVLLKDLAGGDRK